jgi:hypothetical protein
MLPPFNRKPDLEFSLGGPRMALKEQRANTFNKKISTSRVSILGTGSNLPGRAFARC